jgi:tRNA-dihydrouridine synthase B
MKKKEVDPFLYLAPMKGFTSALYRKLYTTHFKGVDAAISPFISSLSCKRVKDSHIKDILPENNDDLPLIPQIISNDPNGFILLSKRFYDLGYDCVNWNLGCPFPTVAKKKRGSGLLPYPERIKSFLDSVLPQIPNRLSIKTRLGRKTNEDIFELIPIFNQYPLDEIVIHPRTGIQLYSGIPDQATFKECLALLEHCVVYNGDIFDTKTFHNLNGLYPEVDRWMLGRGVLVNPFLPEMIKSGNGNVPGNIETFKQFHDDLFEAYRDKLSGPAHIVDKMKGYWQYFSRGFQNGRNLFKKIKKLKSPEKYSTIIDQFFQEDPTWRHEIREF